MAEGILRRDKVKITDQSEALFKQERWFKTKTNDRVASKLEIGLQYKTNFNYYGQKSILSDA